MNAALDVACYIIEKSRYTKTHLQVQKLVYISHGFMLAIHDRPLFYDDVEAWSHGPTIPSIYGAFERWGSGVIGSTTTSSSPCTPPPSPPPKQFDDEERKVIDSVYENYGKFSGYHLSGITRNRRRGVGHTMDSMLRVRWREYRDRQRSYQTILQVLIQRRCVAVTDHAMTAD